MKQQAKGAVLTTAGGILWGCSGTMGQYLFTWQGMDARWLTPVRLGGAGLILLLYSLYKYGVRVTFEPWRDGRERRDLLVYGLLGVSACQFLYFVTIQLSSAGVATILQELSPVFILLAECLLQKRSPRLKEIWAIILALFGLVLITTHGDLTHLTVAPLALAAGLLSAVSVMIYNVVPKKLMEKYPILLLQSWAFLMGSAAFCLLFRPWTFHYVPGGAAWFGIIFVIVVGNCVAYPCYMTGVRLIGPEKGILYGFSEPLSAAILGILLFHSTFTAWDAIGFAAEFAMLYLISSDQAGPHLQTQSKVSSQSQFQQDCMNHPTRL